MSAKNLQLDAGACRIMYFMVHRFKEVAMMAETEIAKYQDTHSLSRSNDNEHPITSLKGGIPMDGLLATKAVSHFNLGTSLELLFKLILAIEGKQRPKKHPLRFLFDQLSTNWQRKVLSSYNHARQGKPECLIVATQIGDSSTGAQPTGGKIDSLRGFLDCLDSDVSVSKQRYIYEPIHSGEWVQFLDDISVFTNMIDRIMSRIKIKGLMEVVGGYAP